MKKRIIVSGCVLLVAAVFISSYFWFINTYKNPVKGDDFKGKDEIADYKTLSDGKHTIAVGYNPKTIYYKPHMIISEGFLDKMSITKGLLKLYDDKGHLVKTVSYGLDHYYVSFEKAYVVNNGFYIIASANLDWRINTKSGLPKERKIKLQYDNNLNLTKSSDIKNTANEYYIFNDINIYVSHKDEKGNYIDNKNKVTICNQDDKIIKTVRYDFDFKLYNISYIDGYIFIQGSKFLDSSHLVGYTVVYNKNGDFLWDYQNKELQYAAMLDVQKLPDHTFVLYGEANNSGFWFKSTYNKLSGDYVRSNIYKINFALVKIDYKGRQIKKYSKSLTNDNGMRGMIALKSGNILAFGEVLSQNYRTFSNGYILKLDKNLNVLENNNFQLRNENLFFSPDNGKGFYTYSFDHGAEEQQFFQINDYYAFEIPGRVNHFNTTAGFGTSRNVLSFVENTLDYIMDYINIIFITAFIICAIVIILYLFHTKPKYKRFLINLIRNRKISLNDYSGVKAIVFDVGKTLNYPVTGNWFITPRMFDYIDKSKFERIHKLKLHFAFKKAGRYLDRNHALHTEEEEYSQFIRFYSILAEKLPKLCCDEQAKLQEAIEKIAWEKVYSDEIYGLYDDVRKYLPIFKEHFKLGVLSDTWPSLKRFFINNDLLGYFDSFVMSCDVGACKPDPKMYQTSIRELSMKPEQIVFVDDSVENLAGAERLGMLPVQIRREGQKPGEYPCVDNLKELAELLKIEILEKEAIGESKGGDSSLRSE